MLADLTMNRLEKEYCSILWIRTHLNIAILSFRTKQIQQNVLLKNAKTNDDTILEALLAFNVVDIKEHEDNYEVLIDPNQFYDAKKALIDSGFSIHSGEVKLVAQDKKDITDDKILEKLERFLDSCENDDDIQSVVHNLL